MNHESIFKQILSGNQSGEAIGGAALVKDGEIVASGYNRVQQTNDPIAIAEMECIRQAGRRDDQKSLALFTMRYPDIMVAGTLLQFSIGEVVIDCPPVSSYAIDLLRSKGISVTFCVSAAAPGESEPGNRDVQQHFMREAYHEALDGYRQGGVPVGAVMVRDGKVIARGRNQRIQRQDPILHGETDCLRNAGVLDDYTGVAMYTTLSPCMMCTGAILNFGIRTVVVGEDVNFPGNLSLLREEGVDVVCLDDPDCKALMSRFIAEQPGIWHEDIAGNDAV